MSIVKLFTEIADISDNFYEVVKDKDNSERKVYIFSTEDDIDYGVHISMFANVDGQMVWVVGFSHSDVFSKHDILNSNPIKVFNTIFAIIAKFYKDNNKDVDAFIFHTTDNRKERIYKKYIKKFMPHTQIHDDLDDPTAFLVDFNN